MMKYLKECLECDSKRIEKLIMYRCPDCGAEFVSTWERWISVEDRLPEGSGEYVVYGGNQHGSIIEDCDWFDTKHKDWWKYPHHQITHWMPLPPPPESEG